MSRGTASYRFFAVRQGVATLIVAASVAAAVAQTPIGTGFNYQGRLKVNGILEDGACDCIFRLFDAPTGGIQVGPTLTFDGVGMNPPPLSVVGGLFDVRLDFGANAFDGDERWLDLQVRCPSGGGSYIAVSPRQLLQPAPYAIYAVDGRAVSSLSGPGGVPQNAVIVNSSGHVGVGTALPTNPLTIATETGDFGLEHTTGATNLLTRVSDFGGVGGVGRAFIGTNSDADFHVFTNGTTKFAVKSGGNVGIGTTDPLSPLHISGASDRKLQFSRPGVVDDWTLRLVTNGPDGLTFLHEPTQTHRLFLGNNGNIGAGTDDPQYPLHVTQPNRAFVGLRRVGQTIDDWSLSLLSVGPGGGFGIYNESDDACRFFVDDNGDVGVGTIEPAARLHITAQGDGAMPLLLGTESPWAFEQVGSGPAASLAFRNQSAGTRFFNISGAEGQVIASVKDDALPGADAVTLVSSGGAVFIGANPPITAAMVRVGGDIQASGMICGNGMPCPSDERLKKNDAAIENAEKLIRKLRPVTFEWRADEFPQREFPAGPQIGFIAQEIRDLVPAVVHAGPDGYYGVDYGRLTPLLVAAFQESEARAAAFQEQIEAQAQQIACQTRELDHLRAGLSAALARLDKLESTQSQPVAPAFKGK